MMTHNHKLESADVVAVFDTQAGADEAVLGLRAAGFRDDRIGYFARNLVGLVTDYLGQTYAAAGTALGIVIGAALGVWLGWEAMVEDATPFGPAFAPGPNGVMLTWAVCMAIVGGTVGALAGWGIPRGDAVHYGSEVEMGQFVIAVTAGERAEEARAILHNRGGRDARAATEVRGGRSMIGQPVM